MTAHPLVSVSELAAAGDEAVLLDATVELPAPRADGDHRVASGRLGWLAGHIPGSRHVDLTAELTDPAAGFHFAHLPPAELASQAARWGVAPGRRVVVYDQGPAMWAARLWWELRAIGVDVQVLDGGLPAWRAAGLPVTAGVQDEPPLLDGGPPTWPARSTGTAWADRGDVLDALAGRAPATLVCSLGEDVFSGAAATRYSRRGHIPGSRNLPARGLLDGAGRLKAAAALHQSLRGAEPGPGGRLILYCGGGISAALLALGLTVDGVAGISVYDGSLEEWTADPELPVEVTA